MILHNDLKDSANSDNIMLITDDFQLIACSAVYDTILNSIRRPLFITYTIS